MLSVNILSISGNFYQFIKESVVKLLNFSPFLPQISPEQLVCFTCFSNIYLAIQEKAFAMIITKLVMKQPNAANMAWVIVTHFIYNTVRNIGLLINIIGSIRTIIRFGIFLFSDKLFNCAILIEIWQRGLYDDFHVHRRFEKTNLQLSVGMSIKMFEVEF